MSRTYDAQERKTWAGGQVLGGDRRMNGTPGFANILDCVLVAGLATETDFAVE